VSEKDVLNKLSVIANLIALHVTKDMDKCDSAWALRNCGMSNTEISDLLGISADAVSAHISNMKKKIEKEGKAKKSKEKEK
jgi:predicted HTH transcriptional regulator